MKPILLFISLCATLAGSCVAESATVPQWAWQDADTIQKAGIVIGRSDGTVTGRRPTTRAEFAAAITPLLVKLSQAHLDTGLKTRLRASSPALLALQDLIRRFKPELISLKVDTNAVQARLTDLQSSPSDNSFPDVPKDHWAAKAVETLRCRGIVVGYPSNKPKLP